MHPHDLAPVHYVRRGLNDPLHRAVATTPAPPTAAPPPALVVVGAVAAAAGAAAASTGHGSAQHAPEFPQPTLPALIPSLVETVRAAVNVDLMPVTPLVASDYVCLPPTPTPTATAIAIAPITVILVVGVVLVEFPPVRDFIWEWFHRGVDIGHGVREGLGATERHHHLGVPWV